MADILITPGSSIMSFTSSLNYRQSLTQEASGSLTLLGSGSTGRTDIFTIAGNNGTLFSVSDDLSDSLFSVNTIAGLPVIEAFANNSVTLGTYGSPAITVNGTTAILTGSLLGTASYAANADLLDGQTGTYYYAASNPNGYTTNTGTVTSVGGTGTVNGISLSGTVTSAGNLTLGGTLSGIGNSQLTNSAITVGSTAISLGSSATTIAGLSSVTSTTFVGALTGNASTATSATTAGSVTGLTLTNAGTPADPDAVTQNQIGYNNNVSLFGQTDGGLYSSAYSSAWIHQIFGDFRTGQIAIRGKNSGTWQSWRTVLDSTNYNSYTPTLTGTGASGTWGISISGNAATATSATSATTATSATSATSATTAGSVTNAVTFNNGGSGDVSGTTYNGSAARTISYNTIGAYAATNPSGYTTNTGTVTSVGGTGTVSGISLSGTVTTSGNLSLSGTISGLTNSNLSGTAGISNANLANSTITVGSTAISLGSSATTIAGLSSVTSTTFVGALSGNATTATTATNIQSLDDTAGAYTCYPIFTKDGAGVSTAPRIDSTALFYVPQTNTLTAGTFSGALSGNASTATSATTATNANNVAVTDTTTGVGPYYLTFVDGTSGNRAIRTDSAHLILNSTTNELQTGNLVPTGSIKFRQSTLNAGSGIRFQHTGSQYWDVWITGSTLAYGLQFRYAGGANGGYLAAGADVSNIDFTGQHRSLSSTITYSTIEDITGLIVISDGTYSNLNSLHLPQINEALPNVSLSDRPYDKRVFGVISDKEESGQRHYAVGSFISTFNISGSEDPRLIINSLGEGGMWVCDENGPLENGDYITTSTIPGFGMKQNDDVLHNYTVAKITEDCLFNSLRTIEFDHSGSIYKKQFVGVTYHCG